ncbi:MAG: hypothetical protein AB1657_04115 [Candidatus Micrarchaeota archaeon]
MKLRFDADSLAWMGSQGLGVKEVSELAEILGAMKRSAESGGKFLVPLKADERVSALVSILYAITDVSGMPTCFGGECVSIPAEARQRFGEALQISREERLAGGEESEILGEHLSKARRRTGLRGKKGR